MSREQQKADERERKIIEASLRYDADMSRIREQAAKAEAAARQEYDRAVKEANA